MSDVDLEREIFNLLKEKCEFDLKNSPIQPVGYDVETIRGELDAKFGLSFANYDMIMKVINKLLESGKIVRQSREFILTVYDQRAKKE